METRACPGCGLRLEQVEQLPVARRLHASPECFLLNGEVTGFTYAYPWLLRQCHQMTVDTYGAQHAGRPGPPIGVAYSLVGLHLALDRGLSGLEVREAHARLGKPDPTWPSLVRPSGFAAATIEDVARAGVWSDSPEGHAAAVPSWARAIWAWWEGSHSDVEQLTERLLGKWLSSR